MLLIDRIQVKQAAGDADMLIVKETLLKAEVFDSIVVHSRDMDVFVALLNHLHGDIPKNVIMETKKGCVSISEIAEQLSSEIQVSIIHTHRFRM